MKCLAIDFQIAVAGIKPDLDDRIVRLDAMMKSRYRPWVDENRNGARRRTEHLPRLAGDLNVSKPPRGWRNIFSRVPSTKVRQASRALRSVDPKNSHVSRHVRRTTFCPKERPSPLP